MELVKNCRRCLKELSMCDIDIHPACLRSERAEASNEVRGVTQFERGLERYPYKDPDEAA